MRINFAHLRERSTNGGFVDFAIFDVNAADGTDDTRSELLFDLTTKARYLGLKVDISALVYRQNGSMRTYGDRPVVDYLSNAGLPRWTHYLDV